MKYLSNEAFSVIKLEKHDTKDIVDKHINGSLTVIWRDWDDIIKNHPKMIYITSVFPNEVKGPHLHTKRSSYFICIRGKVVFVIKDNEGKYHEIISDANEPSMVYVSKNVYSAHMNLSKETSSILTLADIAWRPNDDEMKNGIFSDYDWSKWK